MREMPPPVPDHIRTRLCRRVRDTAELNGRPSGAQKPLGSKYPGAAVEQCIVWPQFAAARRNRPMAPYTAASVPSAFDVLRSRYIKRLPAQLEDLAGPSQGTVDLPLHVAWSGRRSYALEGTRSRVSLYRTVLAEGQREDLEAFLNRDLLVGLWPVLRTLVSRPLRDAWEPSFPELADVRTASAA